MTNSLRNKIKSLSVPSSKPAKPKKSLLSKFLMPTKKAFWLVVLGLSAGVVGGLGYYFWGRYALADYLAPHAHVASVEVQKMFSLETYSFIFSTPALRDINQDGRLDINVGTTSAGIFAYDGATGKLVYRFNPSKEIIAPPIFIDANDDGSMEAFWVTKSGQFYVLNREGKYLYTSKSNEFYEEIVAKPALSRKRGWVYLAGMRGSVWCVEKSYGLVRWAHRNNRDEPMSFFAAPMLIDANRDAYLDVLVADTSGRLTCLNGLDGGLVWELQLEAPIRASMSLGRFLPEHKKKQVAVFDLKGYVHIISQEGVPLSRHRLSERGFFITSPVATDFIGSGYHQLVNASPEGHLIVYDAAKKEVVRRFVPRSPTEFRSSPILAHLNEDNHPEVIAASTKKELFIIDGGTFELLIPVQYVESAVTATPLLADIDNDNAVELVVACENGQVNVYRLGLRRRFGARRALRSATKEFLANPENHNAMP